MTSLLKPRGFLVASSLAVAMAVACASADEPKKAAGGVCLVSDDCEGGLVCMDRVCARPPSGVGGEGSGGSGGAPEAGDSGFTPIMLAGAGGELGEQSCVDICEAARHCPGVDPKYDCDASCSTSADLVTTTGCDAAWNNVLRCTVTRGACAACQSELTSLYDCVKAHCADNPGSIYCSD